MSLEVETDLKQILTDAKRIAVVGHSDRSYRTSYQIAQYLRQAGYTVYPVNPTIDTIDGEPSYPSLASLPEKVDIVNVFRRSEHLASVIQETIGAEIPVVWSQLGVVDEKAAQEGRAAGLTIVMDRCIKVEHRLLLG